MRTGADAVLWVLQGAIRVVLAVLEVFLPSGSGSSSSRSSSRPAGRPVPDPIEREAMAEARAKLRVKPCRLASVRIHR